MDAFKRLAAVAHTHLGDTPERAILRDFAMGIQSLRLSECGFEESINTYSAAELLLLSCHLPGIQRAAVVTEAMDKADDSLRNALVAADLMELSHG